MSKNMLIFGVVTVIALCIAGKFMNDGNTTGAIITGIIAGIIDIAMIAGDH